MEDEKIKNRIETMLPMLDERQTRIYLASEAQSIGWGGQTKIASLSGKSRFLIARGEKELLDTSIQAASRDIRRKGGGRKKETDRQAGLAAKIKQIIDSHTVGYPERLLLWTSKSVRHIQDSLKQSGYKISHETIRRILSSEGYSLQTNRKVKEGGDHVVDRDAQFEYISHTAKSFIGVNQPVISVDCKKKELIGSYKNSGREWQAVKNPVAVNVYDFVDKTNGKASPYGVYDIANNKGFISVGISKDTSEFAVATIRRWWNEEGKDLYKYAENLYITADGGGSNGSRNRLWKMQLQAFANETGLNICVSHFPPGTSKWNKIEHRLFSYISMNWRGKPLESLLVILGLIGATTTKTGLRVKAVLDEKQYETGIK
ncbi:MAG: ISAzo13 family transposase, partial [Prevotellaceae bacterium]|nr:ISAzo13 family transposase [Prevotellaceae bacterium]